MADTWLLRWDTGGEGEPEVLCPAGSPAGTATVQAGAAGFVAVDGYLFDGAEFPTGPRASDASLVAAAYERWGDGLLEKLRGGFTLAVWDRVRRRVLVGRDAMGLSPCFYSWNGRVLLASPSLDALLDSPEVGREFNRVVITEYLQSRRPPEQAHETFYENVRRLPPAHGLTLSGGRLLIARWWDPVPPGFSWAGADEIAGFEPILERAVHRCLSVGADSIALSGGFDSVSLAVLAAEQRRGRAPLHAVSLRFPGAACDESETQTRVARALGMPHLLQTIEESLGGEIFFDATLALSSTSPSPVLSPWSSMYAGLLRSARALGLSRLLMGTGGDDLFNVDLGYGADRLAALDLRGLWRFYRLWRRTSPFSAARVFRVVVWDGAVLPEIRRLGRNSIGRVSPGGLLRLRRHRLQAALRRGICPRDPHLLAALEQRLLKAAEIEPVPGGRAYVGAIRSLTQAPLLLLEQDQSHAWAARLGFRLLLPYFDRDLMELSLRIHPEHLVSGGRSKPLLRRLVAERLPSVPMRAKKVDFTRPFDAVLRRGGRRAWEALGGPSMLADLGIVGPDGLERWMNDYFEGGNTDSLRAWLVLSTEAWLRARSGSGSRPAQRG